MRDIFLIIISLIIIFYLGEVCGLAMLCHSTDKLKFVGWEVAIIPLRVFGFIIYLLFAHNIEKRLEKVIVYVFKVKNKALVMTLITNSLIQEHKQSDQKSPNKEHIQNMGSDINSRVIASLQNSAILV